MSVIRSRGQITPDAEAYLPAAVLVDNARLVAVAGLSRALHGDQGPREEMSWAEGVIRRRLGRNLDVDGRGSQGAAEWDILLAGYVAGHLLSARLRAVGDRDDDTGHAGRIVRDALTALAEGDQGARLAAGRELLAHQGGECDIEIKQLGTLLIVVNDHSRLVAAAGTLARQVQAHFVDFEQWAETAWYGAFGAVLLRPVDLTRAAAVHLVVSGRPKVEVARLAGISRVTLDKWIRDYAEQGG